MRTELAKSVIGTRRLVLRPLRKSDAAALFPLFSDWEVLRYLSSPPNPYTPADAEGFVARAMRSAAEGGAEIAFAITLKDQLIGTTDIRHRPASHLQSGEGDNIGYWIGRPYWGQGLMTEAARGLIAHTFALTRVAAIYSGAFANNTASLRVQEKIGFVRESVGTLFSKPHGRELAHVNTALARASFERMAA
jgi:RimJ/RimL family protein N-acetyltransferase